MRPGQLRRMESLLGAAKWCCLGGAAWILVHGLILREPLPKASLAAERAPVAATASEVETRPVKDLTSIWERDLRQDLFPPKPKEVAKASAPPPPPPVKLPRLLATFVEGGRSYGLLVDVAGGQRVRTAGEMIDEMEVAAIEPGRCSLKKGERTYEVRVMKPAGEPSRAGKSDRGE